MASDTCDCCQRILATIPLAGVLVSDSLCKNIRMTLVQVTFYDRHQGALAFGTRKTKNIVTGSVTPQTSTPLLLPLSGGPWVTGIIQGATRTVLRDGHDG